MKNTTIIYHKNCWDGIVAAWVANKVFPGAHLIPYAYGEPLFGLGDLSETNLVIVDISFSREIMEGWARQAAGIVVLDHHKTAQAACEGLPYCIFDMYESGASLAWKYFKGETNPPPALVAYVRDRDLWRFDLEDSEAINAFIQSYPMLIEVYDTINHLLEQEFESCRREGHAILRYKTTMVKKMCDQTLMQDIGGYKVPVVNATILYSEVGNQLCETYKDHPFSAYYMDRADGKRQWGLRSIGDFDVSEVAKKLGGGGHKNAAGFVTEIK